MTETESKIVQLLNSDEDCNKILGLMLGRNELGVDGLLSLINDNCFRWNEQDTKLVNEIKVNNLTFYIYRRGHYGKHVAKIFPPVKKDKKHHLDIEFNTLSDIIPLFKRFLKLTIDDNKIQPTT